MQTPAPALVGSDVEVPLVTGGRCRYVNLDYAASAPCLVAVARAVEDLLPWYASVHRGTGFKSQVTTEAYEGARHAVADFVGARADDTVLFTRNTTDSLNLLAAALRPDAQVFTFAAEHHADLLPWRRRTVTHLPIPETPDAAPDLLARALAAAPATGQRLVGVTGASNVTGEIWPYRELARVAHAHGARLVLDAAQLAPHRAIDLAADGVDYLALSGHKLYAPLGAGVLVGRPDWLADGEPFLAGGGAVRFVTTDDVLWAALPDRQEAGSPNVLGAVALGVACRTLRAAGQEALAAEEDVLLAAADARLAAIPAVRCHRMWPAGSPRIAVLPFSVDGFPYARLAAALSAEYGIGVRHGCFCAHPLLAHLLGLDRAHEEHLRRELRRGAAPPLPGAVRASLGLGTTADDVDRLADALETLTTSGPRWSYASTPDGADAWPEPDPRPRPSLPVDLVRSESRACSA